MLEKNISRANGHFNKCRQCFNHSKVLHISKAVLRQVAAVEWAGYLPGQLSNFVNLVNHNQVKGCGIFKVALWL